MTTTAVARRFSTAISKTGIVVVVSVEYGLARGNKHSGSVADSYKALRWARKEYKLMKTAEGKFFPAGLTLSAFEWHASIANHRELG
jgi:acetyl esterase/lipase